MYSSGHHVIVSYDTQCKARKPSDGLQNELCEIIWDLHVDSCFFRQSLSFFSQHMYTSLIVFYRGSALSSSFVYFHFSSSIYCTLCFYAIQYIHFLGSTPWLLFYYYDRKTQVPCCGANGDKNVILCQQSDI